MATRWEVPVAIVVLLLVAPAASALVGSGQAPRAPASNDAWAREAVERLERATLVNDEDGDKVFDELERAFATQPAVRQPAIVVFQHDVDPREGLDQAREVAGPIDASHVFDVVPSFAADLTLDQVHRIAAMDGIRQIELDNVGQPELDTATASMGVDAVQEQLEIDGNADGDPANFTKDDVTIAVLDTGFDGKHADLDDGKIIHFLDAGEPKDEAYDGGTHGTHVASIAAGTGDGDPKYTGVAPGASVVGLKIIGDGQSSESLAIEAYEWIVENHEEFGIDISTISFGFGTATDGTTALEMAIDEVWEAGVVNFKSTGNGGPERRTITVPAAARGILATGAMLDPEGDSSVGFTGTPADDYVSGDHGFRLASFSSRGPTTDGRIKPDIAAPGVSVMAADEGSGDGYTSKSGTSMASPFAAGSAALLLDANPNLTPEDVRDVLQGTTENWGLPGPDVDYGAGRLQVTRAATHSLAMAGQQPSVEHPAVPFHETRAGSLSASFSGSPPAASTVTIPVENASNPVSLTVIAEGDLGQVVVEDPDGNVVLSEPSLPNRQTVLGFQPVTEGDHTVRLLGEPGIPWVLDASLGSTGVGLVPVPNVTGPLEQASTNTGEDGPNGVPLGIAPLLGAIALAGAVARRRGA